MIYWQLLWVYLKIGTFGFGGGYAMLSLIQHEIVDLHHWLTPQQFTDVVAISQMTPGPIGINSATYVGYAVTQSVWGAVLATVAVCLPSFVIMMLIAMFFARFQDNEVMIRIFNGIRPAVVALILFPCISAVRALKLKYIQLIAPLIATVLIWQFGLSPIYVVLAGIAGGLVYILWLKDKIKDIKA